MQSTHAPQGGNEFGLGYNLDNGKAAQAAEDPFNHKPLLKEDPKHPGKVVLTQDAIQRRKVRPRLILCPPPPRQCHLLLSVFQLSLSLSLLIF